MMTVTRKREGGVEPTLRKKKWSQPFEKKNPSTNLPECVVTYLYLCLSTIGKVSVDSLSGTPPQTGCSPPSPLTPFLTSGSRRYSDRNDKNQAPSSRAEWPRFGTTSSAVLSPPTALSIGSKPSTVYQAQRADFLSNTWVYEVVLDNPRCQKA